MIIIIIFSGCRIKNDEWVWKGGCPGKLREFDALDKLVISGVKT